MSQGREDPSWNDARRVPGRAELLDPRTQFVADREAYLGQGRHDVGRRISDDQVELFVAGDLAHSLQQEFTLHKPAVRALVELARTAPRIAAYDAAMRKLGGDPDAALNAR